MKKNHKRGTVNKYVFYRFLVIISEHMGMEVHDVMQNIKCRKIEYVQVRHLVASFLYTHTKSNLKSIGRILGKHHATIINSISQVADQYDTNKTYAQKYSEILDDIEIVIDRISPISGRYLLLNEKFWSYYENKYQIQEEVIAKKQENRTNYIAEILRLKPELNKLQRAVSSECVLN